MRTSDLIASISALAFSAVSAQAFDGSPANAVAPAVSMDMIARGQAMKMTMKYNGKRLGDCVK